MNRNIKIAIIVLFIAGIILLVLYNVGLNTFSGKFESERRKELTENFIQHEKEFADLTSYFNSIVNGQEQMVSFGLKKSNRISLIVFPTVIDPANKAIGGENLEIDSPELDSALIALNWTHETMRTLKDKLSKTNCDWIRTTEIQTRPIEIYSTQSGWGSFSYLVFKTPLSDSLVQIHGKPISGSEFGSRVVLSFSSTL